MKLTAALRRKLSVFATHPAVAYLVLVRRKAVGLDRATRREEHS